MVMKEDGRILNKKNKQRHKVVKCEGCKSKIDCTDKIDIEDFDKISPTEYVFYCDVCGETNLVKM